MKSTTALVAALLALVGGRLRRRQRRSRRRATPRRPPRGGATTKLSLVAYAVPKVGFDKVIPLFDADARGQGRHVQPVLRRLRRPVAQGRVRPADRRRQLLRRARRHPAREVRPGRRELEPERAQGHPVRLGRHDRHPQGQPEEHQDLGRPAQAGRRGRHARTRSPRARAKWNLLAPYAEKSNGGQDPEAGPRLPLQADRRAHQGPAEVRPRGDRDVPAGHRRRAALLRERGAVRRAQRRGRRAPQPAGTTFKIENPVAVLNTSKNKEKAQAFVDFLYTPEGQKAWAEAGFRPVDQTVAQEFASDFPEPEKLYTIDDLGGWSKVNDELFEPETGSVAKIYDEATS